MSTAEYSKAAVAESEFTGQNPSLSNSGAHNLSWSNVNFSVGDKKILTDCWGQVRITNI